MPGTDSKSKSEAYLCLRTGVIQPHGADTDAKFRNRIFAGVNDCVDGNSLVFTHCGVLRTFIRLFGIENTYVGNLGFIIIEFDDIYKGAYLHSISDGMI
jgi:broad specificity phosphatase PhoE